jgi:hypothetical protein
LDESSKSRTGFVLEGQDTKEAEPVRRDDAASRRSFLIGAAAGAIGSVVLADASPALAQSGVVSSVFGRTGAVVATANDYSDAQIAGSPTNVLTSTGDLLYASAANTLARRAIGTAGQVLTVSGGVPTWGAPPSTFGAATFGSGGNEITFASGSWWNTVGYFQPANPENESGYNGFAIDFMPRAKTTDPWGTSSPSSVWLDILDRDYINNGGNSYRALKLAMNGTDNGGNGVAFVGSNSGGGLSFAPLVLQGNGGGTVGVGQIPHAAAVLDLSSTTTLGFLPPLLTTAQKNAISAPPAGLLVFDTTLNTLSFYSGTAWHAVSSA